MAGQKAAFLIVDVQDCFLPGGSLGVYQADTILNHIVQIYQDKSCLFDLTVRSQDYHPPGHISFASSHGLPPFADVTLGKGELPLTCVKPADGNIEEASCCPSYYLNPSSFNCSKQLCPGDGNASFTYPAIDSIISKNPACTICQNTPDKCFPMTQRMWTDHCLFKGDSTFPSKLNVVDKFELIQKGDNRYVDSYSAFADNTHNLHTPLNELLKEKEITKLYVAGIATDVVVAYTVRDAIELGYEVVVVGDATKGIFPETEQAALREFESIDGATVLNTSQVLATECPGGRRVKHSQSEALEVREDRA